MEKATKSRISMKTHTTRLTRTAPQVAALLKNGVSSPGHQVSADYLSLSRSGKIWNQRKDAYRTQILVSTASGMQYNLIIVEFPFVARLIPYLYHFVCDIDSCA